jgi:hypothetical protein
LTVATKNAGSSSLNFAGKGKEDTVQDVNINARYTLWVMVGLNAVGVVLNFKILLILIFKLSGYPLLT